MSAGMSAGSPDISNDDEEEYTQVKKLKSIGRERDFRTYVRKLNWKQ